MGTPQIIVIILCAFNFGISSAKHGKPRPEYNVFHAAIDLILTASLLYWGGFWSHV